MYDYSLSLRLKLRKAASILSSSVGLNHKTISSEVADLGKMSNKAYDVSRDSGKPVIPDQVLPDPPPSQEVRTAVTQPQSKPEAGLYR